MEPRHDRVGIAEIGIMVLEDSRSDRKAAEVIDENHPGYRIAAILIQGDDAGTSGW